MKTLRRFALLGCCILVACLNTTPLQAQPFTAVDLLYPMDFGDISWGDYDNDGDLDVLTIGEDGGLPFSQLYRNDTGSFIPVPTAIPHLEYGGGDWGDYDADGDLDLVVTGADSFSSVSAVYRNDAGNFTDIQAGLLPMYSSQATWGDYDNDGDLDLLQMGWSTAGPISQVYRNDAGIFTDIGAGLPPLTSVTAAWGDYDNDGDLDLVMAGFYYPTNDAATFLFRNDAGIFTSVSHPFANVFYGGLAWGDYDNDGDLDLLLVGSNYQTAYAAVYRNDGSSFTDIQAPLPVIVAGAAVWGDYDSDGDLDILISGSNNGAQLLTRVYRNNGGNFVNIGAGLMGLEGAAVAWGDYDNDGDLDFIAAGEDEFQTPHTLVYRNNATIQNTPPAAPTGLAATLQTGAIRFTWNSGTDAETPSAGLSYRLWMGTAPDSMNVAAPMADTATGWRRIAAIGNLQGTEWTLRDLLPGETYFACVQAIDAGFMGSPCSQGTSLLVGLQFGTGLENFLLTAGPNPTADRIRIALPAQQPGTTIHYSLATSSGAILPGFNGTFSGSTLDLDLHTLPSAIYLLQLDAPQFARSASLKIIRQ